MRVEDLLISRLGQPQQAAFPEMRFDCPVCIKRSNKKTADVHGHLYVNVAKGFFFCQRCSWKGKLAFLLRSLGLAIEPTVRDWKTIITSLSLFTEEDHTEPYDPKSETFYPCDVASVQSDIEAYMYMCGPRNEHVNGHSCRGLSSDVLDHYKIRVGTGKWSRRIFIPTWYDNVMTFWVARDFSKNKKQPKYLNPGDRSRRYHLFGLDQAKQHQDVIITEGVFSAIAAGTNAVCSFGKFVTQSQLFSLADAKFRTYFVALDGDARPQAFFVARWLTAHGLSVRVVDLPIGEDPDSYSGFRARVEDAKPYDWRTEIEFLCGGS